MDSNISNTSQPSRVITFTMHGFSKRVFNYTTIKECWGSRADPELVDDVAAVNFKINTSNENDNISVYMVYKKLECKEDTLINIKVTCVDPKYSKEFSCSKTATKTLIFITKPNYKYGKLCTYEIHIYVQAYQVPTPTLSRCEMFYNDQDFTDFCFVTNDGKVPVHRACMVAHSEVFKAMLHGEWKETVDGHIKINGDQVTLQTLIHLKDYMYLGKLPVDEVELQTLLLIADRFMMHHLRDLCIRKLPSLVTAKNFLDILKFATCNEFTKLTFAILLLTPEDIVYSAYNLVKNELVGPGQQ